MPCQRAWHCGLPLPRVPRLCSHPAQHSGTPAFGIPGLGWELELAAEPMWLVRVLEAQAWKYSLGSFATRAITAG